MNKNFFFFKTEIQEIEKEEKRYTEKRTEDKKKNIYQPFPLCPHTSARNEVKNRERNRISEDKVKIYYFLLKEK